MKKILPTILLFSALLIGSALAAPAANPVVRVGMYYGDYALVSANLQNITGSGYRFGYFKQDRNYTSLLSIQDQKITMAKDVNFYYYDGTFYTSGAPKGSKMIGAYHIQPDKSYATANEASAAASALKMQGTLAIPAYVNGSFKIRIGSYIDISSANADKTKFSKLGGSVVVGASATCITVINTANGTLLFEYDAGSGAPLGVYPSQGEVAMPLTWFKGYKYNGGFQYSRNSGNITVINYLPMQEYVMGVVPYEMSAAWPLESLKAQAICARTYANYNFGKHGSAFDVCNATDCQVYHGANSATDNSNRAVTETYGTYILFDGKPINAVFHSSDGGATEDAMNVWFGDVPYLKGVKDPYEDLDNAIYGRWSFEYTPQEMTNILNAKGYKAALIKDAYVEEFTPMGNVLKVTFVDINGTKFSFSKEGARTIMCSSTYKKYTYSQRYKITRGGVSITAPATSMFINDSQTNVNPSLDDLSIISGGGEIALLPKKSLAIITANGTTVLGSTSDSQTTSNGNFVFSGTGWGHNVGMSQNGAKAMALLGHTAEEILKFYYTDVEICKVK